MTRSFAEWLRFSLLVVRIREEVDPTLADLMQAAWESDSREDWAAVHDRLNVIGEFDHADRVRELCDN